MNKTPQKWTCELVHFPSGSRNLVRRHDCRNFGIALINNGSNAWSLVVLNTEIIICTMISSLDECKKIAVEIAMLTDWSQVVAMADAARQTPGIRSMFHAVFEANPNVRLRKKS